MAIYQGVNGVNREIKQIFQGVGGVNRQVKERWEGVGGVNLRVHKRGIGGIDANTLLMLHGEDFTDSSLFNTTTIISNTFTINQHGKFNKCLCSSKGYMKIRNSKFVFGVMDFTIDFWLNTKGLESRNNGILGQGGDTAGLYGVCARQSSDSKTIQIWLGNGRTTGCMTNISNVPLNMWNHIAIVRNGTYLYSFLNGNMVGSNTGANLYSITSDIISLGCNYYDGVGVSGSYLNGYMDEVRIAKLARWTSNFTPPQEPYSE